MIPVYVFRPGQQAIQTACEAGKDCLYGGTSAPMSNIVGLAIAGLFAVVLVGVAAIYVPVRYLVKKMNKI